jgi:hypothetical protein
MDEKENSKKGLNLEPLGYKGDSNHYISFFSFENNIEKTSSINHCAGTIKRNLIFFPIGIILYCIIIASSSTLHLTCFYYLMFALLGHIFGACVVLHYFAQFGSLVINK